MKARVNALSTRAGMLYSLLEYTLHRDVRVFGSTRVKESPEVHRAMGSQKHRTRSKYNVFVTEQHWNN